MQFCAHFGVHGGRGGANQTGGCRLLGGRQCLLQTTVLCPAAGLAAGLLTSGLMSRWQMPSAWAWRTTSTIIRMKWAAARPQGSGCGVGWEV